MDILYNSIQLSASSPGNGLVIWSHISKRRSMMHDILYYSFRSVRQRCISCGRGCWFEPVANITNCEAQPDLFGHPETYTNACDIE